MTNWIKGTVIKNHKWNTSLFTLTIKAPIKPFIAGQFTKLALDIDGYFIQRAYSYVNAPDNEELEFYLVHISDGQLTKHLELLKPNDLIYISEHSSGFFILNEIPKCHTLWMLSTGTAIGPFLSILQFGKNLDKFNKIILVHAVRYAKDLSYLPLMKQLENKYSGKLKIQTIVSREKTSHSLMGRIPLLIKNHQLENVVQAKFDKFTSHVMICGNPEMVKETCIILNTERNMHKHLRRKPGNITIEQYW
uniref:Flavodoxin/ferredoxin--NADP reductase n=1 Tax=Candidatus Aschnera chinzeii TaxID=1485666 RepID=A0AAT9G429_9ENTR|nr:MAG: ferredoxin--NADP(+) reductase [Candidatus Aschnera chinzeii]